jgi:hypothetical protein
MIIMIIMIILIIASDSRYPAYEYSSAGVKI